MSGSMVERVARALCEASGVNPDETAGTEASPASPAWRNWITDARAALRALSEPTEGMIAAGLRDANEAQLGLIYDFNIADIWRAMISAASEGEG